MSYARAATPDGWAVAKDAVASLDWPAARSRYAALAAVSDPGSQQWTMATFCQAVALQHLQPASKATIDEAASLFTAVLRTAKDERYVARALMNLGRIAELPDYGGDVVDLSGAGDFYKQVMGRWPDEAIGSEAALRFAATLVMTFDGPDFIKVRAGVDLLRQWTNDHPHNPYAAVMWQYAGDTCFRPLRDYAAALQCYDRVDAIGWPDDGNQGPTYWRCARMAELYLNNRAAAVRYYTDLVIKTPTHPKAYAALQALIRLGAPLPSAPLLDDTGSTTQPLIQSDR